MIGGRLACFSALRVVLGFGAAIAGTAACAPHHEPFDGRVAPAPRPFDGGLDAGDLVITDSDGTDGGCPERTIFLPTPSDTHVAVGTPLAYETMPPVGGDHYPMWAAFRSYEQPLDPGYLVHALEHGAVVLWYRCTSRDACPGLASELESFVASLPDDPLCAGMFGGARRRMIVVPEPNLLTVVAASSWGHGWASDCVDTSRLRAFVDAHYDRATESTCAPGIVPSTSIPNERRVC